MGLHDARSLCCVKAPGRIGRRLPVGAADPSVDPATSSTRPRPLATRREKSPVRIERTLPTKSGTCCIANCARWTTSLRCRSVFVARKAPATVDNESAPIAAEHKRGPIVGCEPLLCRASRVCRFRQPCTASHFSRTARPAFAQHPKLGLSQRIKLPHPLQ